MTVPPCLIGDQYLRVYQFLPPLLGPVRHCRHVFHSSSHAGKSYASRREVISPGCAGFQRRWIPVQTDSGVVHLAVLWHPSRGSGAPIARRAAGRAIWLVWRLFRMRGSRIGSTAFSWRSLLTPLVWAWPLCGGHVMQRIMPAGCRVAGRVFSHFCHLTFVLP